jgi:hypothetical protein
LPPVDTAGDPADPAAVERVRRATHDAIETRLSAYRSAHASVRLETRADRG